MEMAAGRRERGEDVRLSSPRALRPLPLASLDVERYAAVRRAVERPRHARDAQPAGQAGRHPQHLHQRLAGVQRELGLCNVQLGGMDTGRGGRVMR